MNQDVFLASLLGRLVELEANLVVKEIRKEKKTNPIKKFFHIQSIVMCLQAFGSVTACCTVIGKGQSFIQSSSALFVKSSRILGN